MKDIIGNITILAKRKNVIAKAVCLVLAIILWALVSSSKIETLKFKIPIMFKNLPADLMVSNTSDKFATVIFEGRNDDLKNPMLKNVKAIVNLENAPVGEARTFPIEIEKQDIPDEIVVSAANKEVMVTVETKEDKWVEVIPSIAGTAPQGKMIVDRTVSPDRVKITGPASAVNDIQSVETEAVPVLNESSEFERQVGLKKDDKFSNITFGERIFKVKVVIADMKDIRMVTSQVKIKSGAKGYGYEMKNTGVEVYIRTKADRNIVPDDIDAFIDVGELNLNKMFENEKMAAVWREFPIIVIGKDSITADIVSYLPKKVWIKIARKRTQ
jgi:YbbR domain-containing protein